MVLARLLSPRDFGLVSMVAVFTGILNLFRDFGLSTAAIQRTSITEEQISTLFWINIFVGALLGLVTVLMAPAIAALYHEPQLFAVTAVFGAGFVINSAGIQHSALLQREMRFTILTVIDVVSLAVGICVGIAGAKAGYSYWALVAMTITSSFVSTIGLWLAAGWIPGMPHRGVGIRSILHFGGTLTLNGLVAYAAFNVEKLMIGRYWGADAIGIYGRAYQLVNIPIDNLNSAVGGVAFSALSRLKDDPVRFKNYFLKGFSLVLGMTLPITIACALFADDVVLVLLGPKWNDAAAIVRLLAPTIAILAIINPLGWLIYSIGLVERSLRIALVFAPIITAAYFMGLPYGPKGIALAYSTTMTLWVIPHILWCVHGTPISLSDILHAVSRPLASGIVAGSLAFGTRIISAPFVSPLPQLIIENGVLLVTFFGALLFVAGQKALYLDLLRGLKTSSPAAET